MLKSGESFEGSQSFSAALSGGMDQGLVESLPFVVWQSDARGESMNANQYFQQFTGRAVEAMEPRDWKELIHPEDQAEAIERLNTSMRDGIPIAAMLRLRRKDGVFHWFEFSGKPVKNAQQEVIRWVGTAMDVDEEVEAKRELSRMRDDLALQVAGLTSLHELGMRLGAIRELPPSLEAILLAVASFHGSAQGNLALFDESIGWLHASISVGLERESLEKLVHVAPGPQAGGAGTCFFTRKRVIIEDTDTDPRFADFSADARKAGFRAVHSTPIMTRRGKILGVISVHFAEPRRPTEREMQFSDMCAKLAADAIDAARSAEAIRESERKIRRVLDSSAQFMGLLDVEGRLLEANSTSLSFIGKTREAVIGRPYWLTEWWDHSKEVQDSIRDAVRRAGKGATIRMETKQCGADGRVIDVEFSLKPIRDGTGEIVNLLPEARDITDRKRVEVALKEAKESAEAANLAKDRFLAMLSHELRTPLAPVLITVAGMEGDPMLPDGVRRDIAMVRRNVELESKLIDDLLDISRITSGKLPLQLEPVDVNEALRHVCAICRSQVLEKKLRLEVRLEPEAGRATADPARLQQVMWNLLKNAIKFTAEGGTVGLTSFKPTEGRARFQVRDTGVGIAPEAMERVFNAFEQGGDQVTRKFGGLGLGLAISKSLIEQHNGTIVAESAGNGRGATFTVEIPAAPPVPRLPRNEDHPVATPPKSVRLLLVEDHEDTAAALGKFLQLSGYGIKRAAKASDALEMLAKEPFDLVLSDIGLPDMTGYEMMKAIRRRWNVRGVAMSGYGMEEDIRKSHESGFDEHLVKPVKLNLLAETIRRLLQIAE